MNTETKKTYEYLKKFMTRSEIIRFCGVSTRDFCYYLECGKDRTCKIDNKLKVLKDMLMKQALTGGF